MTGIVLVKVINSVFNTCHFRNPMLV